MKKIALLLILFCFIVFSAQPQGMAYDSIVVKLSDASLSIDDKYDFVRVVYHLPIDEQISITKMMKNIVRGEKDKAKLITIFAMLDNLHNVKGEIEEGKACLDSAFVYLDETSNVNALGAAYYRMAMYYDRKTDISTAHQYFYKAIDNYDQSGDKKHMLSFIYYKMGAPYLDTEDIESLSKIVSRMLTVKFDGDLRIYYNNIYSFIATYYYLRSTKDSINHALYLDSTIYYFNKSIETYNLYKTPKYNLAGATRLAMQDHLSIAKVLLINKKGDFDVIFKHLEKSKQYMQENDTLSLVKYHSTKALYFYTKGDFRESLEEYIAQEKLFQSVRYKPSEKELSVFYFGMARTYENLNDYKNALKYANLAYDIRKEIDNTQRYEIIKELEVKYETAEKELEISRLNEEQQKIVYNRTLIIGGFVFLVIVLLLVLLYNRFLRLKKEKEALRLSVRINEKEAEYQNLLKETEFKQMRHYLDGLEAERDRLSKNLHDNVANRLFIFDQALRKLDNIPAEIPQQMELLYTEVRNISHELISPVFQYTTLSEILYNHIQDISESSGVVYHLEIDNEDVFENISPDMSHEIYRIIQECTGNITKHSSAKNAKITLTYHNGLIEVVIEDDGVGFDIQSKVKGIGIQIIKDRCKTLNGSIELVSEKGEGCKIVINIPFTQSTAYGLQ